MKELNKTKEAVINKSVITLIMKKVCLLVEFLLLLDYPANRIECQKGEIFAGLTACLPHLEGIETESHEEGSRHAARSQRTISP
jgi:hypothetical protein